MINININNKDIKVKEGTTILEAAKENNISIPHLCYLKGIHEIGSCRLCVVEIEGEKNLKASCMTKVKENMVIKTNSKRVRRARKVLYELIISDHPKECLSCERNDDCELKELGNYLNIDEKKYIGEKSKDEKDYSSPSISRDMSKCILCRRCVTICNEVQQVGILNAQNRGFTTSIGIGDGLILNDASCTFCGQCTTVCPVGALKETDSLDEVWAAINDTNKKVIVQTAPAIRAALGEMFGLEPGTCVTGKMVSGLRELGFDYVFDTNFAADLTIVEEGNELLYKLKKKLVDGDEDVQIPMITSCSPGWIKYIEHYYPDQLNNLSTCKSPHMMMGALLKTYFAKKIDTDPKDIFVLSIMPCTAKKYEITRPEMFIDGYKNVDAVLTTRELGRMLKEGGVDFKNLDDDKFDSPLGLSSGAADIFGATGGVMEAALRSVYEIVTGRIVPFENLNIEPLRGFDRIKEASLVFEDVKDEWGFLEGVEVNVAITSGLKGASILLDQIKKGTSKYHFIEVMACPGGCISGGGQPRSELEDIKELRMKALYKEDEGKKLRKSHENEDILRLYEEYLEEPLGHLSHELLHTTYIKRSKY